MTLSLGSGTLGQWLCAHRVFLLKPNREGLRPVESSSSGHCCQRYWAPCTFTHKVPSAQLSITLHWSCWTHRKLWAQWRFHWTNKLRSASRWTPSHDPRFISGKAGLFACTSLGCTSSPDSPWRDRHLMPWHEAGQSDLKIKGHLMVRQRITVCMDVRQKPVHGVEQKGFRSSADLCQPLAMFHRGERQSKRQRPYQ